MIERRTSAGTRVVSATPVSGYEPIVQSPDDIVALVGETRIRVASSGVVKADRELARRLRCRVGKEWFCLSGPRVPRGGVGAPLCWSDQYLRPELNRKTLIKGDFEAAEMRGQRIEQEITAELLDETRATALDAKPGSPALVDTSRGGSQSPLASTSTRPTGIQFARSWAATTGSSPCVRRSHALLSAPGLAKWGKARSQKADRKHLAKPWPAEVQPSNLSGVEPRASPEFRRRQVGTKSVGGRAPCEHRCPRGRVARLHHQKAGLGATSSGRGSPAITIVRDAKRQRLPSRTSSSW